MTLMKYALAPLAALLLMSAHAAAQVAGALPFSSENGQLTLETLGQRLTLPAPDWVEDASSVEALSEVVSTRFLEESGQSHLEIYPRGEGEAFWSTLYGARISNQASMSLAEFRSVVINVYARSCQPETVALFQLEPDEGDQLPPVGYVCGAYLDSFADFAGQGEVMVMGFYKSEAGLGMVYQEWRGDAFDPSTPSSWPVPAAVVEAQMARLATEVTLTLAD
ncbi:hypothetical protein NIM87_07125 [Devosia sp. XJ19-1]|uniref:Uncharacterized protein n=1 Tax=Devosia ureilytica TaxID=2952754 RepID=A0A9Q4AMJ8_9HYPH|nr:hypothetical protein [Devosia ureilytica]MCP8883265.1 hypothetical protein [Devosia ureilytica]MCP8886367.1 hypothetical protein [Devosia ureilytica]